MNIKTKNGRLIMTTDMLTITIYDGLSTIKVNKVLADASTKPWEIETPRGYLSLFA